MVPEFVEGGMEGVLRVLVRTIDEQRNELDACRFVALKEATAEKRAVNLMAENARMKGEHEAEVAEMRNKFNAARVMFQTDISSLKAKLAHKRSSDKGRNR